MAIALKTHDRQARRLTLLLAIGCLTLLLLAAGSGSLLESRQLLQALLTGELPPMMQTVVLQWRMPRAVFALLLGAALGISGAVFQSLLRNPLGSPDVIGFGSGAHTGALIAISFWQAGHAVTAGSAIAGGLLAAALVYLLAWRKGVHGLRLILTGIAVSAMLAAFNTWLMLTVSLDTAISAAFWTAGSLNGITWAKGLPAALACLLAIAAILVLSRRMLLLEMGDDTANALGLDCERTRLQLMGLAVVLIAAVTAATGPIAFVALAAPQLAQQVLRSRRTRLLCSAWMGALLLLAADYMAQHLFHPVQLPVGLVTICIGGLYLIWLLLRAAQTRS